MKKVCMLMVTFFLIVFVLLTIDYYLENKSNDISGVYITNQYCCDTLYVYPDNTYQRKYNTGDSSFINKGFWFYYYSDLSHIEFKNWINYSSNMEKKYEYNDGILRIGRGFFKQKKSLYLDADGFYRYDKIMELKCENIVMP